jgi:hypothetical protein
MHTIYIYVTVLNDLMDISSQKYGSCVIQHCLNNLNNLYGWAKKNESQNSNSNNNNSDTNNRDSKNINENEDKSENDQTIHSNSKEVNIIVSEMNDNFVSFGNEINIVNLDSVDIGLKEKTNLNNRNEMIETGKKDNYFKKIHENLLFHYQCKKMMGLLVNAILSNFCDIIVNNYGNYIIQYLMNLDWDGINSRKKKFDLKYKNIEKSMYEKSFFISDYNLPTSNGDIFHYFKSHICKLAVSKYSSNVVEKCLCQASPELLEEFIDEIIDSDELKVLVKDPFGNYVVAKAWELCLENGKKKKNGER